MPDFFTPDIIVLMAGGAQIAGYLVIHQVALRLMMIIGSFFYVWYYAVAADDPLWSAIWLTLAMIAANCIGLLNLYARQSRFAIPARYKDLFARFSDLPPGDFRAVMLRAKRHKLDKETQVTREGAALETLTYVISGGMRVEKGDDAFRMPAGLFVGEVAYLMSQHSAASTWIAAGSEVLQWDVATLRRISARTPRFRLALEAMISKDLAAKVQVAVAPNTAEWRAPQRAQEASASSSIR